MNQSGNKVSGTGFYDEGSTTHGAMSFTGTVSGPVIWIESPDGRYSFYGTVSNFVWIGGCHIAYPQPGYCANESTIGSFTLTHFGPPFPGSNLAFTATAMSGTNLTFVGSGGVAGNVYHVLRSTDAARPLRTWACIGTNNFDNSGNFSFTDTISSSVPQRFITIQIP